MSCFGGIEFTSALEPESPPLLPDSFLAPELFDETLCSRMNACSSFSACSWSSVLVYSIFSSSSEVSSAPYLNSFLPRSLSYTSWKYFLRIKGVFASACDPISKFYSSVNTRMSLLDKSLFSLLVYIAPFTLGGDTGFTFP